MAPTSLKFSGWKVFATAIEIIFALFAEIMPLGESSMTIHSSFLVFNLLTAVSKGIGEGLPSVTSSLVIIKSKKDLILHLSN